MLATYYLKNREQKMLRKAKANAETARRFRTAEGFFRWNASVRFSEYLVHIKEAYDCDVFMKGYMLGDKGRSYRYSILYKLKHLRELP